MRIHPASATQCCSLSPDFILKALRPFSAKSMTPLLGCDREKSLKSHSGLTCALDGVVKFHLEEVAGVPGIAAGRGVVGDPERVQPGVVDTVPPADVDGGLPGAPMLGGRALPKRVHWGQREAEKEILMLHWPH